MWTWLRALNWRAVFDVVKDVAPTVVPWAWKKWGPKPPAEPPPAVETSTDAEVG